MQYDIDDPPPREGWSDIYWHFANRWAENFMAYARAFGFIS